jgi:hypothetical protein
MIYYKYLCDKACDLFISTTVLLKMIELQTMSPPLPDAPVGIIYMAFFVSVVVVLCFVKCDLSLCVGLCLDKHRRNKGAC